MGENCIGEGACFGALQKDGVNSLACEGFVSERYRLRIFGYNLFRQECTFNIQNHGEGEIVFVTKCGGVKM